MAASPLYLDANELRLRLGTNNYIAFFNDDGSQVADDDAVNAVIQAASRRTTAAIAPNYTGTLPFPVDKIPEMAIELTYQYVLAILAIRNPDFFIGLKLNLADLLKQAESMAKDLRDAIKRMVDAEAPVPSNVGGGVSSMADAVDFPCPPKPFFDDMGDY